MRQLRSKRMSAQSMRFHSEIHTNRNDDSCGPALAHWSYAPRSIQSDVHRIRYGSAFITFNAISCEEDTNAPFVRLVDRVRAPAAHQPRRPAECDGAGH